MCPILALIRSVPTEPFSVLPFICKLLLCFINKYRSSLSHHVMFILGFHSRLMWCRFSRRVNSRRAIFRAWPRTFSTASPAFLLTSWLSLRLFDYLHFSFLNKANTSPFGLVQSVDWNCLIFFWVWIFEKSNLACTHFFLLHFHQVLKSLNDIEFQKLYLYREDLKGWTGIFDDHFWFVISFLPIVGGVVHSLF